MGRSRATKMFLANHPSQHEIFVDILKSAKHESERPRFIFQREKDEMNSEYSNMMKNRAISQFREEDFSSERQRKRQKLLKKVTWRQDLVEVYKISTKDEESYEKKHNEEETPGNKAEEEAYDRLGNNFLEVLEAQGHKNNNVEKQGDKLNTTLLQKDDELNTTLLQKGDELNTTLLQKGDELNTSLLQKGDELNTIFLQKGDKLNTSLLQKARTKNTLERNKEALQFSFLTSSCRKQLKGRI